MKAKLLDNLMVRRDEDFRKSLFPFISPDDSSGPRFTRFIREKDSPSRTINYDIYSNASGPRFNFNPESQPANQPLPLSQLLHRYKDASLTMRKKKLSWRESIVQTWANLLGGLLMETNVSRVFGKQSSWLLVWNIFILFGFLFNIFEIPIAIFFTQDVYRDEYKTAAGLVINWTIITLLFVNLLIVRPNTQFQKMGYLISDRREIINNYFGLSLAVDLTGLIVLMIYASAGQSKLIFMKLLFYIELRSVFQIDEMMLQRLELLSYRYAFYRLLRLLTYMLFIIIWLSSIFFYIDYHFYLNNTYPYTANWLTYSQCTYGVDYTTQETYGTDLITTYPHQWYIWLNYAAYWALQTISTVGYGDITPRNPESVVFTNIAILIMMFFFVFFINSIIEILDETTSSQKKQKTNNLRRYKLYHRAAKKKAEEVFLRYVISPEVAKQRNIQLDKTADKIRSYLQEMDISGQLEEEQNVEQLVNQNLTPQLREELFVNYRQLFFKKVLLFGEVAKIQFGFMQVYEQLIYQIKEVAFGSGQIVYSAGEYKQNALYYLLKGCIRLSYPRSRYTKQLLSLPGDRKQNQFNNFGVRGFFTREARDHTAITEGYCKVQELNYHDFIKTIRFHPHFHRKYCELRDLLIIQGLEALTGEECFECGSRKHHLLSCDRCLFNFPLFSRKKVIYRQANKENERRHYTIDCHRQPYFLRDCIRSQRVPLTHTPQMRQNNFETVCNYDEYFPTRNLNVEYFY